MSARGTLCWLSLAKGDESTDRMSKFMGLGTGTVIQPGVWGAEPPDELESRIIVAR